MNSLETALWRGGRPRPSRIESITIVGSTCAGKSTTVRALRELAQASDLGIVTPKRYISRPPRLGEAEEENVFVTKEQFEELFQAGRLTVAWERDLGPRRREFYGFEGWTGFPVLSANNAILHAGANVRPSGFLDRTLLIGIYASPQLRLQRINRRSPDVIEKFPEELQIRMTDDRELLEPHCDYFFESTEAHPSVIDDVMCVVREILDARRETK